MKIRSIHKLNSRIRNYLCLFIIIFFVSSLCSTILFFWSVFNEVDDKASTWTSYFTERILFLENIINSRATFDHGITSILKVTPEGEVINSRPFPTELTSIADSKLFKEVKHFAPGEAILVQEPVSAATQDKRIFLIQRMDSSFAFAQIPPKSLLPVSPCSTVLFIHDKNGNNIFHSENGYNLYDLNLGGINFAGYHVFASAQVFTPQFGGFTITLAKDISTEFYAGLFLITFTGCCLLILMKRSAFLTWDLAKNEQDFSRIGDLLKQVSSKPNKKLNHLPAIEYTAERIREVDWDTEARKMSFIENRGYINATSFFAGNILKLLDEIAVHSKELDVSRQEYRDLVQIARSIIIRIDLKGNCTFFNEYAQLFFGFSEEEMLGKSVIGTLIPKTEEGESDLEQLVNNLVTRPEHLPVNTNQNIRKDGTFVWIYWANSPVYDEHGTLTEILCVGTDITEQKEIESELQDTRNYVRNIIDSMPSAIIGLNDESRVTHFNSAAQALAVIPVESIEGTAVEEAFPSITQYIPRITHAIETGIPETGIRAQGLTNPASFQDIIIYPLNDGMKGAVIRIDDATERVHMEEMMIQTEKMMSIGGLAAGMAHEINNPLGGILQGIQNIIRRVSPSLPANHKAAENAGCTMDSIITYMEDRKIIKTLNGITDSGVRAADIVSGMLEFSRKSDSRKAPGDLRKMMDKASNLAMQDYNPSKGYDFKKIRISKEYDEQLKLVQCTETEIEQVFLNLLRNSAQAMSSWRGMENEPQISIQIANYGNMVQCSIKDNGPGMDECTRKRVFEPFYTTKAPGSGTGLGLSVSYFIISQNHMGKFKVDSAPGKGTTFTILLPALVN